MRYTWLCLRKAPSNVQQNKLTFHSKTWHSSMQMKEWVWKECEVWNYPRWCYEYLKMQQMPLLCSRIHYLFSAGQNFNNSVCWLQWKNYPTTSSFKVIRVRPITYFTFHSILVCMDFKHIARWGDNVDYLSDAGSSLPVCCDKMTTSAKNVMNCYHKISFLPVKLQW